MKVFDVVKNTETLEDLGPRFWVVGRPVLEDMEKIPSKRIPRRRCFWAVVNVTVFA